jgi:DUF2971 family protein
MRLYKYCPPARVDILESGMIALTRPRAFNDPFELMPNISQFDNWLEMGNHVEEITRHFVVLSLAENKDSLLMWAHYTDSYRGFLIGLEGPEAILATESRHRDVGPVSYCHHRPSGAKFRQITIEELCFRKSSEWAYEREWRIVDSAFSADVNEAVGPGENCWLFRLNPAAIREVILGHRSQDIAGRVIPPLLRPEYQHVNLLMAHPDHERFQLRFRPLDKVAWPRILDELRAAERQASG